MHQSRNGESHVTLIEDNDNHEHICDTPFNHPAFSAAATPFGWLLKDRAWGPEWAEAKIDSQSIVEHYGIDSHPDYEPRERDWLSRYAADRGLSLVFKLLDRSMAGSF